MYVLPDSVEDYAAKVIHQLEAMTLILKRMGNTLVRMEIIMQDGCDDCEYDEEGNLIV